ncbi:hypothetical protein [Fulvivirga sp.]|uniref:hypothetical protein n=1 Tax=Fulvivirga sp. TaxID=1931237 RepID=UPI0032ECF9A4
MKAFIQLFLLSIASFNLTKAQNFIKFSNGDSEQIRGYDFKDDSLSYYSYGEFVGMDNIKTSQLEKKKVHIDDIDYLYNPSEEWFRYIVKLPGNKGYESLEPLLIGSIKVYHDQPTNITGPPRQHGTLYIQNPTEREVHVATNNKYGKGLSQLLKSNNRLSKQVLEDELIFTFNKLMKVFETFIKEDDSIPSISDNPGKITFYSSSRNKVPCTINIGSNQYIIKPSQVIEVKVPAEFTNYITVEPESKYRDGYLVNAIPEFNQYYLLTQKKGSKGAPYFLLTKKTKVQFEKLGD